MQSPTSETVGDGTTAIETQADSTTSDAPMSPSGSGDGDGFTLVVAVVGAIVASLVEMCRRI